MTDDERMRQHWQELAEQLGLESEPESPAVDKPPAKVTSLGPPSQPPGEEAKAEPWEEQERISRPPYPEIPGREAVAEESVPPVWPTENQPAVESSPEEAPPRRRGRRSEREDRPRGSRARNVSPITESGTEEVSSAEETGEEKTTGRGRRRKASPRRSSEEETPAPVGEIESEELAAEPSDEENADKDDLDTLTDWNVPSWTELIDSLYRPDR